MKKNNLLALLLLVLFGAQLSAQNVKRPESYNYLRGVEALENEKSEEALEYFNKDVKENPKNGYSYTWIAVIRLHAEEYGRALTAADLAVKHIPKKDAEYVVLAYNTRASVYLNLEDTVKALADYATAIKLHPEASDLYENRGDVYYEQERYDLADADYKKLVELSPGETIGYMGLGRNANAQERWDDAIKQFDYVTKLDAEYSQGYSFRAEAYMGKEKWAEATDDIVKSLDLSWDRKALYLISQLKEPAQTLLISKLKVQMAKSPNEAKWPYFIAQIYEKDKQYAKAIEYYTAANERDASDSFHHRIAICQTQLGRYEAALQSIDQALNMDSTDYNYLALKADIYYSLGDSRRAISTWDEIIAAVPDEGIAYHRRGWYKRLVGDLDGAIEDYTMAIVLDPEDASSYESRGNAYLKQGKRELAEADFKKVVELEDSPEKYETLHFAYQGLGENAKAIEVMDSIIARDTTEAGNYYNAACLYSRMANKAKALEYLEKSLQMGYNQFTHIERDYDMDFLRDTPEFKALIEKYKSALAADEPSDAATPAPSETVTSEVPFTKEDGICKVKCQINGLPLHFVFDTGASDVTLSMVEASFMMKNGYLTKNDVVGKQHYMDANGNVSVGTVVNLKDVNFGGLSLSNVRASVVGNQKAPLLLGQSILGRLGKIEIDNAKQVIKITHKAQ